MKDREANKIVAKPVSERTKEAVQGFIGENVSRKAMVYTDNHRSYIGFPYEHESVNHSVGEYVREQAHTNGIESFWAALKRGYYGTYHRISPKHLERYVTEFAGRHNVREFDTIEDGVPCERDGRQEASLQKTGELMTKEISSSKANWKNRTLFHGDNLDFLRAMNSESVDLIATDPPFKKGRDFHATADSLASGASF